MVKKIKFLAFAMLLMTAFGMNAQLTTASMSGLVTDENNEGLIGATITAVHTPSGTKYNAVSNLSGNFSIQGMRTGGPYTVTVTYVGYQPASYNGVTLQLGETYSLDVKMTTSATEIAEVVVEAQGTKFVTERTGAALNINNSQIAKMPTINRSLTDITRMSPYGNGMSFAGSDGRSTNFTIDGANFNNNFGLSSDLPGGGNPVSLDAIEEIQVVVAPFDVRQTNFIGGGVNAITKSGTNTFKGTAYYYYRNQDMRGNSVAHNWLGERTKESKTTWGLTLGGPIIKDKLFFFVNYEKELTPGQVINYRAARDTDKADEIGKGNISRTTEADLQRVSDFAKARYGYDTGSFTNFPGDESAHRFLARIDWNINDNHHFALRFNNTKNTQWNSPNGNSSDTGYRLNNTYRVGNQSMSYANSMYSMDNKVWSISGDLNSRFGNNMNNQLLVTYTNIEDTRGSTSSPFPFIDIMAGKDADGNQIMEPYISLGYELFTWNNGVHNKVTNITDNFTFDIADHKLSAGVNFEHQVANNAYMRNGTGYYRYNSIDDFLNEATPESFAITYGFNGEANPNAQVTFNQLGLYLQDEWKVNRNFKLSYGVRFDELMFDNGDLTTNKAIYDLTFRDGQKIDTGKWPKSNLQISPRAGFVWDVKGDKTLKVRGGTGLFAGRLPLVFFTNMPTNANLVQNSVQVRTTYQNGVPVSYDPRLDLFNGNMVTNVDDMISLLNLPTQLDESNHVASNKLSGVDRNFKMPQIWKSSIAVDYQLPVSFPLTVTGEFIYTKNVHAVVINNINIKDNAGWERFNGADNRYIYPADYKIYKGTNAVMLENTNKGHGYIANLTVNARPLDNLNLMMAYTHTVQKEVSGMPGSDPVSTWQGLNTIDGPNFATCQGSQYAVPDKLIASVGYDLPFTFDGVIAGTGTHINLFYTGSSYYGYSYLYTNDMNGDGISNDLMYIPKDDSEIKFKDEADRAAFWAFVNQDGYLKNHKGEYAEAYAARSPWCHRFDLRIAQDLELKIGATRHKLQVSADFFNIGNMLNSKWGAYQTNAISNNGKILKYEGMDANRTPIFSMYKDKNGDYLNKSYDYNINYSQCWQFQIGVKYFFN